MPKIIERVKRHLIAKGNWGHTSYSQCGEDHIIRFLFDQYLGIEKPSYLDLGAHHPNGINNTRLLYRRGSSGINIEANPDMLRNFERLRPREINLNIGVVDAENSGRPLDFFVMSVPKMSTFSEDEAQRLENESSLRIARPSRLKRRVWQKSSQSITKAVFQTCFRWTSRASTNW